MTALKKLFFLIACLLVAGCSAPLKPEPTISSVTDNPVVVRSSPTATQRPTHTATPTRTPIPLPTAALTATPVPPPEWLVKASLLPGLPADFSIRERTWLNPSILRLEIDYVEGDDYLTSEPVFSFEDSSSGSPLLRPTPTLFPDQENSTLRRSPKGTYYILCEDPDPERNAYRRLKLYFDKDNRLISQVTNISNSCSFDLRWSTDEKIITFTTPAETVKVEGFWLNIYAWKPDGSHPVLLGQGSIPIEPGAWSPDGTRLAIEILNPETGFLDDPIYRLFYLNGRPARDVNADLGIRAMAGVSWLTDNVLYELNTCCVMCSFYDYYIADTGERLEDISWEDCNNGGTTGSQNPVLSPDQKWFVVDKTDQDLVDVDDQHADYVYSLFNFTSRQAQILSQTPDLFLDFIDWDQSSSRFFMIRRPVNHKVKEDPAAPFGLLSLDPRSLQMRLINPDIRYAWLSPDRQAFLGISTAAEQPQAALYNLDGTPLTGAVPIVLPQPVMINKLAEPVNIWNIPESGDPLYFAWSPSGRQVVFLDRSGNLWLSSTGGSTRPIASRMTLSKHYPSTSFTWSPDEAFIMIHGADGIWMVSVGESQ